MVGVNSDQMHVSGGCRRRDHHAQQEPEHLPLLLGDECVLAEFVEEHRIGATTCGSAPPLVENRNDIVVVCLGKAPDPHLARQADNTNASRTHGEPIAPMSQPAETPEPRVILFCPFCREGFEGIEECPEHELTLLPWDRLPPTKTRRIDEVAFFVDPRLGRGGVWLGASLVLLGFLAPFVRARGLEASALEVAIDGAHNLWLTPAAALGTLGILFFRRTRQSMRAARVAVVGLAVAGALPLVYTTQRVAAMTAARGGSLEWLWGCWAMSIGLALIAFSSFRLGGKIPRS